jgi:hypothetical protein
MTTREAIQQIMNEQIGDSRARIAKVIEVTDTVCSVETADTETAIYDVRLQIEASNGLYFKPAVGSYVMIAPFEDNEFCVVMYSAIDEIKFLDGSFGGLVKVIDLVSKMNAIENKVNSLITYINAHTHASNGTPPTPLFSGGSLTNTVRADIESDKITHGTV